MSQSQQFDKLQYTGEASAYGTEGVSYTELARAQNTDLTPQNGFIHDRGLGEGINPSNTYYGPFSATGQTAFDVVNFDFLKHWVGPKSGTGTSADHYKLTEATAIDVNTSNLQPFSIERLNDTEGTDSVEVQTGCIGNNFTLSGDIGSKLNCSCDWIAQKQLYRATHETYTPVTDSAFIMLNGTWKWGSTPSELSGVRSFSIAYSNNLNPDDYRTIESRFITQPVLTKRTYTFTVSIIMSSSLATTIINDFYGYESGGVYSPEDGSTSIKPTTNLEFKIEFLNGNENSTIWLDQCSIDRISKPGAVTEGIKILTFEGTAREARGNVPIEWWTT